jgi:pimeloyl-ACP methyl ester carboxylesterase
LEVVAEALRAEAEGADVIVGHDLGGVLAAMVAKRGQGVVLSGTSLLRPYWDLCRATALPPVDRYFYDRHAGGRFLGRGTGEKDREGVLAAFLHHGPLWPARMKRVARGMQVPRDLSERLRGCAVAFAWGQDDPWYPLALARWEARQRKAPVLVGAGRHLLPWEAPEVIAAAVRVVVG